MAAITLTFAKPFQHSHPVKSTPVSDISWNYVARIQSNARLIISDMPMEKVMEIAEAISEGLDSFYNDCEYLRWMGHELPSGTRLFDIYESDSADYPSPNDVPYSDVEIVSGYCIKLQSLTKHKPAQIFAVFALMKLDDMAARYVRFKKQFRNVIDLEMSGMDLCDAMEALSTAYHAENIGHVRQAIKQTEISIKKQTKTQIAKHAAAGRTKKYAPIRTAVLKKYTSKKYASPNAASFKIWEDICKNKDSYPENPLSQSRGRATVYSWLLKYEAALKGKKTTKKHKK